MRTGRNVTDLGCTIDAGIASILAGNNITFDTVKTGSSYPYQVIGSTIDSSTKSPTSLAA